MPIGTGNPPILNVLSAFVRAQALFWPLPALGLAAGPSRTPQFLRGAHQAIKTLRLLR